MRVKLALALAAVAVMATGPVQAAQLLTDGTSYAGPVIAMGAYPDPFYILTNTP